MNIFEKLKSLNWDINISLEEEAGNNHYIHALKKGYSLDWWGNDNTLEINIVGENMSVFNGWIEKEEDIDIIEHFLRLDI